MSVKNAKCVRADVNGVLRMHKRTHELVLFIRRVGVGKEPRVRPAVDTLCVRFRRVSVCVCVLLALVLSARMRGCEYRVWALMWDFGGMAGANPLYIHGLLL